MKFMDFISTIAGPKRSSSIPKTGCLFPVCPVCKKIPHFDLSDKVINEVEIHCSCGNETTIRVKDYFKELQKIFHCEKYPEHSRYNGVEYCPQCKKRLCVDCLKHHNAWIKGHETTPIQTDLDVICGSHKDKPNEYYCLQCKEHFCSLCLPKHREHKNIHLSQFMNLRDVNEIKDSIRDAEEFLYNYYVEAKEKYIAKLKQEIKDVEEEYKRSKEANEEILMFIKNLFESYLPNNFFSISNLIRNVNFNLTKFEFTKENSKLIPYLQTKSIVNYEDTKHDYINDYFVSRGVDFSVDEFKEVKILREQNLGIHSLHLLTDGRLASCTGGGTIRIYSLSSFTTEMIIEGHLAPVFYISQMLNGNLISSSFDKTIKIWAIDKKSYKCLATLEGHTNCVNKVIPLSNERIASCGFDKEIRIWDGNPPYKCLSVLKGHTDNVVSVIKLLGKEELVSSSQFDEIIRFWNLNTYECEHVVKNVDCSFANSLFEYKPNRILVGGENVINVIDCSKYTVINVIEDKYLDFVSSFVKLIDGTVLFGTSNGHIFHLDPAKNEYKLLKEKAHKKVIYSMIKVSDFSFASCSDDNLIKIWK